MGAVIFAYTLSNFAQLVREMDAEQARATRTYARATRTCAHICARFARIIVRGATDGLVRTQARSGTHTRARACVLGDTPSL
eukprot:6191717-Pleurochrysis_carterae.AAC.1